MSEEQQQPVVRKVSIIVRGVLNGGQKTLTVETSTDRLVSDFKKDVAKKFGAEAHEVDLIFCGSNLDPSRTVGSYGLQQTTAISMVRVTPCDCVKFLDVSDVNEKVKKRFKNVAVNISSKDLLNTVCQSFSKWQPAVVQLKTSCGKSFSWKLKYSIADYVREERGGVVPKRMHLSIVGIGQGG